MKKRSELSFFRKIQEAVFDISCQRENAVHIKSTTLPCEAILDYEFNYSYSKGIQREFGVRNPPKRNTILGLVNKLETTGSMCEAMAEDVLAVKVVRNSSFLIDPCQAEQVQGENGRLMSEVCSIEKNEKSGRNTNKYVCLQVWMLCNAMALDCATCIQIKSWQRYFMYGKADGNAALARRLYQERYPQRQCPDRKAFVRLHYRLCEYGKFNSPGLGRGRPRSTTQKYRRRFWRLSMRMSMRHRCEVCIQAGGGHFEHLL
ncbi:hypothetical protein ANN_00184 [Periplaneta americana]|uniref:DUF4817 domain-containing protein n=1 Tax=Periplaneta americana TaxID=6978 RepID=A0ABQ8TR60_PERAM|nr:hypothetical protein ANN_00184 [Periplaneta americana]